MKNITIGDFTLRRGNITDKYPHDQKRITITDYTLYAAGVAVLDCTHTLTRFVNDAGNWVIDEGFNTYTMPPTTRQFSSTSLSPELALPGLISQLRTEGMVSLALEW